MKITQAVTRYWPAIGGVEDYVRMISEPMACLGHNVTVITTDLLKFGAEGGRVNTLNEVLNKVVIRRKKTSTLRFKNYDICPALLFSLLGEKSDVIHAHSFMYFCADAAALAARFRGIPLVFNPYVVTSRASSFIGNLYKKTFGRLLMSADIVLAISKYEKSVIEAMGYAPKRIEIVSPCVDLKEFAENGVANVYEQYGAEHSKIILSVGRLVKSKNFDILIKAMPYILKAMPEARLAFAGPDFGERRYLEYLVKGLKLENHVHFLGHLKRRELISAYKNASIFAFAGYNEAFGIVFIEAMAAGLPIVAVNACASSEIVEDGVNGFLVSPCDPSAFAREIVKMLGDDNMRCAFKKKSIEISKKRFDAANIGRLMEEIYSSLIR